jgi:hypothetical protein
MAGASRLYYWKNVIIGELREPKKGKKVLDREVVQEKSNDSRESLKITIKSSGLRRASPNSRGQAEISH